MQIVVTGASGYIGRVVVGHAIAQGCAVRKLARSEAGLQKVEKLVTRPVLCASENVSEIEQVVRTADAALHLAVDCGWDSPVSERLAADRLAGDGMARVLADSRKPLIMMSGTSVIDPDRAKLRILEDRTRGSYRDVVPGLRAEAVAAAKG